MDTDSMQQSMTHLDQICKELLTKMPVESIIRLFCFGKPFHEEKSIVQTEKRSSTKKAFETLDPAPQDQRELPYHAGRELRAFVSQVFEIPGVEGNSDAERRVVSFHGTERERFETGKISVVSPKGLWKMAGP